MPLFRVTRSKITVEEVTIDAFDRMRAGELARDISAEIDDARGLSESVHEVLSIVLLGPYEGHSLGETCPSCGHGVSIEARICWQCGRALHPDDS